MVMDAEILTREEPSGRLRSRVHGKVQAVSYQPPVVPEIGDAVTAFGTLERPRPALNPGSFDQRRYLAKKNVFAVLRGGGMRSIRIEAGARRYPFRRALARIRKAMAGRIERLFRPEASAFFKALILGSRSGIGAPWQDVFMKTGTSHLLAISGLNIALVAGSLYLVLLLLGLPQKGAAGIAFLSAVAYVLVSGLGLPVQRAGYMTGGVFVSLLFERERNSLNLFFMAFFLLVLADPKCFSDVSFQLSFLCVGALLLILPRAPLAWGRGGILNQGIAVMLGTFPLVLFHFNIFSPIGLLTNLLAIPLFHLANLGALIALVLGGVPGPGWVLTRSAEVVLYAGLFCIRETARLPGGYFYAACPRVWHLIVYYGCLGMFFYLQPAGGKTARILKRIAALAWIAAAVSFFLPVPEPDFRLTILSAGANEIAHVRFASGHHWLVNTGRRLPTDQGERLVAPYLRSQAVRYLTGIILTGTRQRNTGGLSAVFRDFEPEYLFYPGSERGNFFEKIPVKKTRLIPAGPGDRLVASGGNGNRSVEVLGIVRGQMILRINFAKRHFIFVPEVSAAVNRVIERRAVQAAGGETNFLILPLRARPGAPDMDNLLRLLKPAAVVAPRPAESWVPFFDVRRYLLLSLDRDGALTFSGAGDVFSARSFLRGEVFWEKMV